MMNKSKVNLLTFKDIVILSLVFFGEAIIGSSYGYWQLWQQGMSEPGSLEFTTKGAYLRIGIELVALGVAYLYLRYRHFDFKSLNFSINIYTIPLAMLFIVAATLLSALFDYAHYWLFPDYVANITADYQAGSEIQGGQYSFAWVTLAFVNGFFEELFFMGLVFAVIRRHLAAAVGYSLLVRFLFHTYQGLAAAVSVTLMGVLFILFRRKTDMLLPFMLAHTYFDIVGLGFPYWLFY